MYKLLYCIALTLLLVTVLVTYVLIVMKNRKSQARVAAVQGQGAGNQENQEVNPSTSLALKVVLMIGSQLSTWIPFIVTTIYFQYFTQNPAPPFVFEVFALVVTPLNSFLNPVFYSDFYKRVMEWLWRIWRSHVDRTLRG